MDSPRSSECRGNAERSIDDFDEVSFFAEDKSRALCHGEILTSFGIGLQACSVGLVRGETIERDQTPGHIVRAFMRKKITDQVTAASRNDVAPILGIFLELVSLERINLVADDAGDRH